MVSNTGAVRSAGAIPDLTGQVGVGKYPCDAGGFADIWTGCWAPGDDSRRKVAVKVPRFYTTNSDYNKRMEKIIRNELRVWKRLKHPHILPLCGTMSFRPRVARVYPWQEMSDDGDGDDDSFGLRIAMICPWQENGNLNKFLEENAVLKPVERYRILLGVLSGLLYLHMNSIVHGDLAGSNILVGAAGAGSVVLSDFGLSTRLAEPRASVKPSCESFQSVSTLGSIAGGRGVRWAAPEISWDGHDRPTKSSDVYSIGRVILQVLSGLIPYYHVRGDATVIIGWLGRGIEPQQSLLPHVQEYDAWKMIRWCSSRGPQNRPMLITVWRETKRMYDIAEIENWDCDDLGREYCTDEDEDWELRTIGYGAGAFA